MTRASRKRKKEDVRYLEFISASWYVGYAEDDESIEAIMKKFEELDQLQKEVQQTPDQESVLNESQLEELFKRTSAFTVKSAALDTDIDPLDVLKYEYGIIDEEFDEQNDYELADDDFWDAFLGKKPKKDKKPREKMSMLQRYKMQNVRMQDKMGNYFIFKKRVPVVDPNVPTYVRVPPPPLSRSWARIIKPLTHLECKFSNSFETNLLDFDFSQLGKGFQAVYMDPPLLLPGQPTTPGYITMEQFSQLEIPKLITSGFMFVWTEKELTGAMLQVMSSWGFRYVENIAWIKKNLNNTISSSPYTYFNKSKATCLIFRNDGDLELRHQRNPDCEFDFIKPKGISN
jgi:hypothetical protein